MNNILVNGAELSSMSLGQGPAAVMLHGLAIGNMASWFSPVALPLSSSRKVVLYDSAATATAALRRPDLTSIRKHRICRR